MQPEAIAAKKLRREGKTWSREPEGLRARGLMQDALHLVPELPSAVPNVY